MNVKQLIFWTLFQFFIAGLASTLIPTKSPRVCRTICPELSQINMPPIDHEDLLPMKIEFRGIDVSDETPSTVIQLDKKEVRITTSQMEQYSRPFDSTDFENALKHFWLSDFVGERQYVHPYIKDGEVMTVSNKWGERVFINTFSSIGDQKHIQPDTIRLYPFRQLFNHSKELVVELR